MAHKAAIVEIVELSDGALGVIFRCCNDSKTVSHTFVAREDHSEDDYNSWLAEQSAKVEKQHAVRNKAKQFMEKFKR